MATNSLSRFHWLIRGQVQGVGFRPFVYRQAEARGLSGFVRNDLAGVTIEAQGQRDQLRGFSKALRKELPPLASIDSVRCQEVAVDRSAAESFRIESSQGDGPREAAIAVDSAVCAKCLDELLGTNDRRSGYALVTCTDCGPRYTIIRRLPYDRPNTTMAEFTMCAACHGEYTIAGDRRFHAQPIACHDCGPSLRLVDCSGHPLAGDPVRQVAQALRRGAIVALKGLGGFHLAVRADDREAVAQLRRAKQRDGKPLAVMCATYQEASKLVALSGNAAQSLLSSARPIIIAKRAASCCVADNVAPGTDCLGVMLPYTPIHHLIYACEPGLGPLVMTSGNRGDEPLVIDNAEAIERLGPLCEVLLWHDRQIERRVDDSVLLDMGTFEPLPIRRARGFVPRSLSIPQPPPPEMEAGLCVGGELKNTVAVVRGEEVIVSQHLGDLKHPLGWTHFQASIDDLLRLYAVRPQWIACDLHPLYLSSAYAAELAQRWDVPLQRIQHHHAHAASLMAEYDYRGPVLAVVCDGVGYGLDGTSWGGELLNGDLVAMRRVARLRPLSLAGGDAAATDIRRCGLALLHQLVGNGLSGHPLVAKLYPGKAERDMLVGMLQRGVCCAVSSAAGRVFDGVAALLGLCERNGFEAEAGLRLEAAAHGAEADFGEQPLFALRAADDDPAIVEIDLAPLTERLISLQATGVAKAQLAKLFHVQLADAWDSAVAAAVERTDIRSVALSGGVFCNRLLTELLSERLCRRGLRVMRHAQVPPNDGGLSLGQAAVASARLQIEHDGMMGRPVARSGWKQGTVSFSLAASENLGRSATNLSN